MTRVKYIDPLNADQSVKPMLLEIENAFGFVPNTFKAIASSQPTLQILWGAFGALAKGTISPKLGDQIAVAVANYNQCEYCVAAHTAFGLKAGATAGEMLAAQLGKSDDLKTAAALDFTIKIIRDRVKVTLEDIENLRNVGFNDGAVVEIITHIALNIFTNYINVALEVPVDFPKIPLASHEGL